MGAGGSAEVVDSSPSPPRSNEMVVAARGEGKANQDDDAVDSLLAAKANQCFRVSGDVDIRDESGGDICNEPPPKPPGENWEEYFDDDFGSLWYYWPGPGGQWWCGCKEDDVPKPYNFEAAA